jgi:branched-chain amino acid transport system permease protein/urea transport system permease protein|tara:strand:- start:4837 stop:5700 length:864 start_codon:yes stop_codon:yes gene_type:complete
MSELLSGFLDGANYVLFLMLVTLGLAVIFGLMKVINMAHGEFVMLGAYSLLVANQSGLSPWLGLLLAPLVVGLVGLLVEELLIRRVYSRLLDTILATWGLSILLKQAVILGFGPGSHSVVKPLDFNLRLLGVDYPVYRLFIMVAAIAIIAATFWFFFRTRMGLSARSVIANRDMAACLGINTRRLDRVTFSLGAALAGFAGALMAPIVSIDPYMGLGFLVPSFLSILVGGLGSIAAAMAGVGLIGGAEVFFKFNVSSVWAEIIVLGMAVVLIRLFPTGILSRGGRKA